MSLIDEFCDGYQAYNRISPDRRVAQRRVLLQFQSSLPPGVVLELARGVHLSDFMAARLAEGMAPTTVVSYRNMIRPFFTWGFERGHVSGDVLMEMRLVRAPRGAPRRGTPRPYSRKEIARFWEQLEEQYPLLGERTRYYIERYKRGTSPWRRVAVHGRRLQIEAVTALALYGGLRRTEIFNLLMHEMDPAHDEIVVVRSRKNRDGIMRERAVPMIDPMRDALRDWFEFRTMLEPDHDRPWLRLTYFKAHYRREMDLQGFKNQLARLGSGWELHRLRHTYATEQLRAGMDVRTLQAILGHTRIEQTLAYAELVNDDVVRVAYKVADDFSKAIRPNRNAA